MEGHCLTGQSPHWAVVPMKEEEEEEEVYSVNTRMTVIVTAVAHLLWCNIDAQCAAMSLTV